MVQSFVSPRTVEQCMELSTAVTICSDGFMPSTARHASTISFCWILVDCTPCRVLTVFPLSVAMAYGIYFLINLYVRQGNVLSCRLVIDCRSTDLVGEHKLWWWYFASSFILVMGVRLLAISVVANWMDTFVHCYRWVGGRLVGRIIGWVSWLGMGTRMVDASWLIVDPSTASGSINNPVFVSSLPIIKTTPL